MPLINEITHTHTHTLPYISAALRVCRTCCKRSVSTLSQMLLLLVFFCFLVVLFSSLAPIFSLKKNCIPTLIKREKWRKNIKRWKRVSLTLACLSSTCGHVEPSRRVGTGGEVLVMKIRHPLLSTHQPSRIKTFNYGSNEQLLSLFSKIHCSFPIHAFFSCSPLCEGVCQVTGSGLGHRK